jgi:hypothetical protein
MEEDLLKLNMLTITASGLLMLLSGIVLYLFRDSVSNNLRFFLPIPPIGVAAYIYVFNMFRHYQGHLPENLAGTLREVVISSFFVLGVFAVFVILNISITYILNRII